MRKNEEGKLVDENGLTEEEFLSQYQPRDYERPSVTVDMLIFAVDKSGENKRLLLIKRKNHPYLGCWALPGGFVEMKESLREAAARELEEETGCHAGKMEWLITIRTTVAFCNEKIDIYVATDLTPGSQHLDEDEYINVEAYTVDELCEKILSGEIEDSKTISAIMSYRAKYLCK